jgi:hypothetical protein
MKSTHRRQAQAKRELLRQLDPKRQDQDAAQAMEQAFERLAQERALQAARGMQR